MSIGEFNGQRFVTDHRMRKINRVRNGIAIGRIDGDRFIAFADFQRAKNSDVCTWPALLADSGAANQINERECAAIENGKFEVVEFDDCVIDSHADESGKQMLRGGNEHTLFHKTGGVADARDIATDGFNLKTIKVGAAEGDSTTRGCWKYAQPDGRAGMKAHAAASDSIADCLFLKQKQFSMKE